MPVLDPLLLMRIDVPAFLIPLDVVAAALCAFLILHRPWRWILRGVLAAVLAAGVGVVLTWLVGDVWNVFDVSLSVVVRIWVALLFAGVALAVTNLWASRWWRKLVAMAAVVVFLITAAAGINADFGAYRDVNDALGLTRFMPFTGQSTSLAHPSSLADDARLGATWRPPAGMPKRGTVSTASIPGVLSHFAARRALIYLPPAALVADPPPLPVLIAMSGQPGSPSALIDPGQIPAMFDHYAAGHGGLAPIVVIPDQLGTPSANPMCVDSPLGNAATYLTVDVPNWIRSHLSVDRDPRYWAIAGFSEGGTCSIQFGAGHPELFRSIIDILGQVTPTIGAATVATAFGGSEAAYRAIQPLTLLAQHRPYADTWAVFGAAQNDPRYLHNAEIMRAAAATAGMRTQLIISPNSGHDWTTVRYVLSRTLAALCARLGLGS